MRKDSLRVYKVITGDHASVVTAVTTAQSTGWEVVPPVSAISATQVAVTLHKLSVRGDSLAIDVV